MSDPSFRIMSTPAGPMCAGCAVERYGLDSYEVFEFREPWEGGLCAGCYHVMPKDGTFDGRPESAATEPPVSGAAGRHKG